MKRSLNFVTSLPKTFLRADMRVVSRYCSSEKVLKDYELFFI